MSVDCPDCPDGYSMATSNCSCYPSHVCLIDNPCNNGGNCTIQDGDSKYTCTCINNYDADTNCTGILYIMYILYTHITMITIDY